MELYRLIGIPTLSLWLIESPTDLQIQLLLSPNYYYFILVSNFYFSFKYFFFHYSQISVYLAANNVGYSAGSDLFKSIIEQLFEVHDKNRDGFIGFDEFVPKHDELWRFPKRSVNYYTQYRLSDQDIITLHIVKAMLKEIDIIKRQ